MIWHPIETVPRDGTRVVVIIHDPVNRGPVCTVVYWNRNLERFETALGGFEVDWPSTHWLPLPPLPDM